MSLWKKSLTFLAVGALLAGSASFHDALAAKKKAGAVKAAPATGDNAKISSDPDAPTVKENRLLKWGAVDPPDRGKNPEFFFRGVYVNMEDMSKEGKGKDFWRLNILPIEVVENEYRNITMEHFMNGIKLPMYLPKKLKDQFKPGSVVEVHLFYTTKEEQAVGHAKMIAFTYNEQIIPYPAGPASYVKTGGLDPEQYLNALKGMELFGSNPKDSEVKVGLDALASSSPSGEVKTRAGALLSSMFGAQPSGQALLPAPSAATAEAPTKGKKKK
ncbi:MAG: hypothetical protein IT573_06970 [Deltaproteobacteria bacterium]|nr:hypothetical protein [Deltaproteobacteria bacterium]